MLPLLADVYKSTAGRIDLKTPQNSHRDVEDEVDTARSGHYRPETIRSTGEALNAATQASGSEIEGVARVSIACRDVLHPNVTGRFHRTRMPRSGSSKVHVATYERSPRRVPCCLSRWGLRLWHLAPRQGKAWRILRQTYRQRSGSLHSVRLTKHGA